MVATDIAVEKALDRGMATVGTVRCNHIGRVGHFVEMAAAKGCVGIVVAGGFSEVLPVAAPFGGRERVLSTNPVAMGFPVEEGADPVMFDFATTAISGVKVLNAARRGEQLPPGCVVDREGRPTTDPRAFEEGGAQLPFAGHKGYALNVAVEYLGRILTGSDTYAEDHRGTDVVRHHGTTILAVRADLFRPLEEFRASAAEMAERLREGGSGPGARRGAGSRRPGVAGAGGAGAERDTGGRRHLGERRGHRGEGGRESRGLAGGRSGGRIHAECACTHPGPAGRGNGPFFRSQGRPLRTARRGFNERPCPEAPGKLNPPLGSAGRCGALRASVTPGPSHGRWN